MSDACYVYDPLGRVCTLDQGHPGEHVAHDIHGDVVVAWPNRGDLAEFLLARIAEDEEVAREAATRNGATWSTYELREGMRITGTTELGNPRSYQGDAELWDDEGAMGMFAETAAHIARHDPARVLAECEAKRRIVEFMRGNYSEGDVEFWALHDALRLLALPYADHPDYREEWRR